MLRPAFINPDDQSGYGSPWEMQMIDKYLLRGKGGNINGFSSSMYMIPEMKLGTIALVNYEMDPSIIYNCSIIKGLFNNRIILSITMCKERIFQMHGGSIKDQELIGFIGSQNQLTYSLKHPAFVKYRQTELYRISDPKI